MSDIINRNKRVLSTDLMIDERCIYEFLFSIRREFNEVSSVLYIKPDITV